MPIPILILPGPLAETNGRAIFFTLLRGTRQDRDCTVLVRSGVRYVRWEPCTTDSDEVVFGVSEVK